MHGFGQFLGAEVTTAALGQPVENLELADAEAVALAHLALSAAQAAAWLAAMARQAVTIGSRAGSVSLTGAV